MTELSTRSCEPCKQGTPALSKPQIDELARQVPKWHVAPDLKSIERVFEFDDYYRTMAFVNAVAFIAHREDHHPDLEVGYNRCRVLFATHSVGGLSDNDFICAAKVDAL